MAANKFKVSDNNKKSLFKRLEDVFNLDFIFENGLPVKYLPYLLFITFTGIFYIGNNHYADKNVRKISKLKREVQDLRADYHTLKAEYMFAGKQSEVAKRVLSIGLKESLQPPNKIVVRKGEY